MMTSLNNDVPPQAVDVERALLGAMMLDSESVGVSVDMRIDDSFYHPQNSIIYGVIRKLYSGEHPVDPLSVADGLKAIGSLDKIGGDAVLKQLINEAVNVATTEYYCKMINEKAELRKLITLSNTVKARCMGSEPDVNGIIADIDSEIMCILSGTDIFKNLRRAGDVIPEVMEIIEKRATAEDGLTGVPTGFLKLDEVTSGWQRGSYVIVGAPTKMGKTNLGLHFAVETVKANIPVLVFSMEMTHRDMVERLISHESGVETTAANYRKPVEQDWESMANGNAEIDKWPFYIDTTPGMNVAQLSERVKSIVKKCKIKLIVIDYIQLMQGMGESGRQAQVENISRKIKALALSVDIPIVAISQYSRGAKNETRKPVLQDLRDSGALEQDANIVILLHQPTEQEIDENIPGCYKKYEIRTLMIAANRQGPTCDIPVRFKGEIATFMDV